ncbi:MAG: hypothetical protein ACLTDR_06280 [Adlercreutzia equolifaciens]
MFKKTQQIALKHLQNIPLCERIAFRLQSVSEQRVADNQSASPGIPASPR